MDMPVITVGYVFWFYLVIGLGLFAAIGENKYMLKTKCKLELKAKILSK